MEIKFKDKTVSIDRTGVSVHFAKKGTGGIAASWLGIDKLDRETSDFLILRNWAIVNYLLLILKDKMPKFCPTIAKL